jgi:hypothetical protein
MWVRAKVLLDRAPFYPITRPLAGAALGAVVGGVYGALGGALHAALGGSPRLFVAWLLSALPAGATAGLIMGLCTVLDRAVNGQDYAREERRRQHAALPPDGEVIEPHNRIRAYFQSPNLVE